jgi:sortase A
VVDFPAAGLHHEVVVEGTAPQDLAMGPGHRRDTPLPGQPGDAMIYGRDKLFGGPFHAIASVKVGDAITVTTGEGVAKFVVQRIRHAGDTYATPQGSANLTLVTAQSSGWRSGWATTRVVYVDAALQGTPFGDPGGRLATVPKAEMAMKNDPSALNLLVLWLPVVVIGALGAVWAHHHWGVWQTWLVCVPVTLAGLWGVGQSAMQLLPNLM